MVAPQTKEDLRNLSEQPKDPWLLEASTISEEDAPTLGLRKSHDYCSI